MSRIINLVGERDCYLGTFAVTMCACAALCQKISKPSQKPLFQANSRKEQKGQGAEKKREGKNYDLSKLSRFKS